jgi:hypothetical protein
MPGVGLQRSVVITCCPCETRRGCKNSFQSTENVGSASRTQMAASSPSDERRPAERDVDVAEIIGHLAPKVKAHSSADVARQSGGGENPVPLRSLFLYLLLHTNSPLAEDP